MGWNAPNFYFMLNSKKYPINRYSGIIGHDIWPFLKQGLSLSGGEKAEFKQVMTTTMKTRYPNCSKSYHICTDTFGSIATAAESGNFSKVA